MQETKNISCSPKKNQSQKPKTNDDFRKVIISDKLQENQEFSVLRKKRAKKKRKHDDDFRSVVISD